MHITFIKIHKTPLPSSPLPLLPPQLHKHTSTRPSYHISHQINNNNHRVINERVTAAAAAADNPPITHHPPLTHPHTPTRTSKGSPVLYVQFVRIGGQS